MLWECLLFNKCSGHNYFIVSFMALACWTRDIIRRFWTRVAVAWLHPLSTWLGSIWLQCELKCSPAVFKSGLVTQWCPEVREMAWGKRAPAESRVHGWRPYTFLMWGSLVENVRTKLEGSGANWVFLFVCFAVGTACPLQQCLFILKKNFLIWR